MGFLSTSLRIGISLKKKEERRRRTKKKNEEKNEEEWNWRNL